MAHFIEALYAYTAAEDNTDVAYNSDLVIKRHTLDLDAAVSEYHTMVHCFITKERVSTRKQQKTITVTVINLRYHTTEHRG